MTLIFTNCHYSASLGYQSLPLSAVVLTCIQDKMIINAHLDFWWQGPGARHYLNFHKNPAVVHELARHTNQDYLVGVATSARNGIIPSNCVHPASFQPPLNDACREI